MKLASLKGKSLPVAAGLILVGVALWMEVAPPAFGDNILRRLDYLIYDLRYQVSAAAERSDQPIIIVDVDEDSLAEQGRWPWSRSVMAELVERLAEDGAVVVGFDVIFAEPERNIARELNERLDDAASRELRSELLRLAPEVDADRLFAQHLDATDVVLGFFMHRDEGRASGVLPDPALNLAPGQYQGLKLPRMPGYTGNLARLQEPAEGGGFITTIPDRDGVIRRSPLVLRHGERVYPSLSLEMARVFFFADGIELETEHSGGRDALTAVHLNHLRLPTDARGNALVPYQGGRFSFPYIPATDVLEGRFEPGTFDSALVLIGSSAMGLGDLVTTPTGTGYPGVEVHANLLRGILQEHFPYTPDWVDGYNLALLTLVGLFLALVLPMLGPTALVLTGIGVFLLVAVGNLVFWTRFHLDLPVALALVMVALVLILNLAFSLMRENLNRRVLHSMFGQYVPAAHIDAMLEQPEAYSFAGETREMTVLFSDIRGFTSISEQLNAAELKALLNRFFTPVTREIFQHEGTIDKYVGDMVMAFWGAPLEDPRHREHAIDSALAMLRVVDELKSEFRRQGLPEISIGIGINTGLMNVGDMGSSYRRAYTVLGDAVNLGARLESITKYYGVPLLVGEETRDAVSGFVFRLVDRIQVKGKEEAIRVYEPMGREGQVSDAMLERLERHHQALDHYVERRWSDAEAIWHELIEGEPECVLYRLYLERVADLRDNDPGVAWDGIFRHTSK